jgi:hypothetical protein
VIFLNLNRFDSEISDIRPHLSFPSDELFSYYLTTIEQRRESEVIDLLWKMFAATTSKIDAELLPQPNMTGAPLAIGSTRIPSSVCARCE